MCLILNFKNLEVNSNCFIQDFISYFADLEKGIKKETRWIIPSKLTKTNFEDQLGMGISVEWNGKDNVLNRENIFYWMYIEKKVQQTFEATSSQTSI